MTSGFFLFWQDNPSLLSSRGDPIKVRGWAVPVPSPGTRLTNHEHDLSPPRSPLMGTPPLPQCRQEARMFPKSQKTPPPLSLQHLRGLWYFSLCNPRWKLLWLPMGSNDGQAAETRAPSGSFRSHGAQRRMGRPPRPECDQHGVPDVGVEHSLVETFRFLRRTLPHYRSNSRWQTRGDSPSYD